MLLTAQQQRDLARRAQWYFDVYFGPPGDSVVFTGDGLDDLNELIDRLTDNAVHNRNLKQSFLCDVGGQYSDWRPFDIEDVWAIRAEYITFYGSVNKPDAYLLPASTAISIGVA